MAEPARQSTSSAFAASRLQLVREGLRLDQRIEPLYSAAIHYWRLPPNAWRGALSAVRDLGANFIDTYVPWGVHETAPGEFDFGHRDPRLDVGGFLGLAEELGLRCIVRPGPHINAELTFFGLPERVVWEPACQARSAKGHPVVLPVPPLAFPIPSYASDAFHAQTRQWFAAAGAVLAPLCWPQGPIVMAQVDNEGAMFFRDGVYDQDYHPDAIARYRRFLHDKYGSDAALRDAYADPTVTTEHADPPRRLDATRALGLTRHLDWAQFQEQLLADALQRMRQELARHGLHAIPTSHNLPIGEASTPLDPERIGHSVDLVGLDYYHGASPSQRSEIARRTCELVTRCDARGTPAYACELGAGFPPFFPPLRPRDNAFAAMTALAYGLNGFNLYMAVDRDRWIGAPISSSGEPRGSARFWKSLIDALQRLRFHELSRETSVSIVVPRSYRRLTRVLHAFGPLSATLLHVAGGSAHDRCFEEELGMPGPVVLQTGRFLELLEQELDAVHIAYDFMGADLLDHALQHSHWVIVACTGALEPDLIDAIAHARRNGRTITVGPYFPDRDAGMHPLHHPAPIPYEPDAAVPSLVGFNPARVRRTVQQAQQQLGLTTYPVEPSDIHVTRHCNAAGVPVALFAINPTGADIEARIRSEAQPAVDALDGESLPLDSDGWLRLRVPSRTVRMLEFVPGAK